eukprot:CAMPEP_0174233904 /NCGR_PEP_ID=MMETSP0417-20130205/3825_1 /TAXON_ID=242541 /ORGANISM="Mayorella sp, Strain BSH-02190019" /LENGTH=43 /DNA_ID= /DNA_START= /DNA_END= /DNA_ORIENTATION=
MVKTLLVSNAQQKMKYLCSQLDRMANLQSLVLFGMWILMEWSG